MMNCDYLQLFYKFKSEKNTKHITNEVMNLRRETTTTNLLNYHNH